MSDERYDGFDRVSDILAPFGGYGKIDPDVLARAAHRGTRVHKAIHEELTGIGMWEPREGIEGYLISYQKFMDEYLGVLKISKIEERLFDESEKITGAFDLLANINGQSVLIDWKTSSSPQKTWALQGAAYMYLAKQSGYQVDACMFIQLNKIGKEPKIYQYQEFYVQDLKIFKQCVELYRYFFKDQVIPNFED